MLRRLLGHVLPADLRGGDRHAGDRRAAVVRPLHRAAGARARAADRHRAGDRVAARDGARTCGATSLAPIAVAGVAVVVALLIARRARAASRPSLHVRRSPAFVIGGVAQEFCARRARAPRDRARADAASRSSRSCAATAAATAATSSTSAMAVLFVGVAASSSFQHDPRRAAVARAERRSVGGYTFTYVKPTAQLARRAERAARADHARRPAAGRTTASSRGRSAPTKDYFPSHGPALGPVSRFFDGESTSEVGLQAGLRARRLDRGRPRTSAASTRAIERGRPRVRQGRRPAHDRTQAQRVPRRGAAAGSPRSTRATRRRRRSALLVSPMVTWIWLGALIVLLGGLIALWPSPRAASARARQRRLRRPRRARGARPGLECRARRRPAASSLVRRGRRVRRRGPLRPGRAREADARAGAPSGPSSRRRGRPSTARSATPSSTTGPASCPRPTGARSTARCAPRRSRSSSARRSPGRASRYPRPAACSTPSSPSSRSSSRSVADLPGAPALGQGRGHVRRVRRRHRRAARSRRLADGAQPGSLDDPVRDRVRR